MDAELDRIEAKEAATEADSSGHQDSDDTKSDPDGSEEQKQ